MIRSIPWLSGFALGFAVALCAPLCAADESIARLQAPLTDAWRFHRGAVAGAERVDFADDSWQAVSLPHTWNAGDGDDGGGDYFRGDGWYRRTFKVDPTWRGRRVILQFDGANRVTDVWINGTHVGQHRGGAARFRFDVTGVLVLDGENVLAVRVSNAAGDNVVPIIGDWTFYGGLYRPVSLIAVDPVHIDLLDHASPGVFARQSSVSRDAARLDVAVKLVNKGPSDEQVAVRVTLGAADGQKVETIVMRAQLRAGARTELARRIVIKQPRLWDGVRDPYLYQLRTDVLVGDRVRDSITVPVGFRFFALQPDKGFFLNGRHLDLRGVNRHHERAGKGWAITDDDERHDFALIRDLGANAIRQSHYQQSQLWQDLADEAGMISWAEIPLVYDVKDNAEFFANAKQQLRELIRQNHHHPSICFWGIGNETFVRDVTVDAADTNDRLLAELAALAREEDSTRPSTYASNGDVTEYRAEVADVVGFNHYFGWYHSMPEDFAPWLDTQRRLRPDLCIGMSEYGAGADPRQHEELVKKPEAGGPWHPEEWQTLFHETYWQALADRPWVWCKLIWCMFDFGSDGRNEGGRAGINDKGIVTQDRVVTKDAYHFYRANWSDQPMVHITGRRATVRRNAETEVKVYSNAESVELRLNGKSMGTVKPDRWRIARWPNVHLAAGHNTLEAVAGTAGGQVTDRCEWILGTADAPSDPVRVEGTE